MREPVRGLGTARAVGEVGDDLGECGAALREGARVDGERARGGVELEDVVRKGGLQTTETETKEKDNQSNRRRRTSR